MKKTAALFATGILLAGILSTTNLQAQKDFAALQARQYKNADPVLLSLSVDEGEKETGNTASSMAFLNTRRAKKFKQHFPAVQTATWYPYGNTTRFYFTENSIVGRAAMSKLGNMRYTIRYYGADLLPAEVTEVIRSAYKGYRPEEVTEISVPEATVYLVNIRGIDDWLQVRYANNEVTELHQFSY
ncbi:MAG: hypothetical protein QM664_09830 [Flavihumibacter sp.]